MRCSSITRAAWCDSVLAWRRTIAIVASVAVLAGCGGSTQPPPSSPPPSNGGDTITGRERFGWSQAAENPTDLAFLRYALYVDGTRRVVEGETCQPGSAANTFDCSAPLPQMTPGAHTLELASFLMQGDSIIESPRSPAMRVTVAGVVAPPDDPGAQSGSFVSSDGVRFRADIVARGLTDPVDLAAAPDGRILVAERGNRVWILTPGGTPPAEPLARLQLPAERGETALASIAIGSDFSDTRIVYVAYLAHTEDRTMLRVARLRESGGALGQAAVIASYGVSRESTAIVRVAPDGMLFVGIGSGGAAADAQALASPLGKILRIRPDGGTPDDNPWSSPVFSFGHRDPRGLAWKPRSAAIWEVEGNGIAGEVNAIRGGANYGFPTEQAQNGPAPAPPAATLEGIPDPSGLVAVPIATSPFADDLFVSSLAGEDVYRVRFARSGEGRVAAALLRRRYGRIAQITASPDGLLFLITSNAESWGAGRDLLIRLAHD
jgi:glucose/arabinose dehydrogenase